jgi:hypothetical protein
MAYFTLPPGQGGGPDNVIRAYLSALDGIRDGAGAARSPLDIPRSSRGFRRS